MKICFRDVPIQCRQFTNCSIVIIGQSEAGAFLSTAASYGKTSRHFVFANAIVTS